MYIPFAFIFQIGIHLTQLSSSEPGTGPQRYGEAGSQLLESTLFRLRQATTALCGVTVAGTGPVGLIEMSHYLESGKKGKNLREGFSENVRDDQGHESEAEICCQRNSVYVSEFKRERPCKQ